MNRRNEEIILFWRIVSCSTDIATGNPDDSVTRTGITFKHKCVRYGEGKTKIDVFQIMFAKHFRNVKRYTCTFVNIFRLNIPML